jgi:hypothetical protein
LITNREKVSIFWRARAVPQGSFVRASTVRVPASFNDLCFHLPHRLFLKSFEREWLLVGESHSENRIRSGRVRVSDPEETLDLASFREGLRIPTKPAMYSNLMPATCSDPKPAGVPI